MTGSSRPSNGRAQLDVTLTADPTDMDLLAGWLFVGAQRDAAGPRLTVGQQLSFLVKREARSLQYQLLDPTQGPEARDEGGQPPCSLTPSGEWSHSVLTALARLVMDQKVTVTVRVLCVSHPQLAILQVGVVLPSRVRHHVQGWKATPAAVTVLNELKPLPLCSSETPEQLSALQQWAAQYVVRCEELATPQAAPKYSLDACFKELPSCRVDPLRPPIHYPNDLTPDQRRALGVSLHGVPEQVLTDHVLAVLDPRSLARLCCTCRYLRVLGWDAAPGLKLSLYPHQRAAIRWMMRHEQPIKQTQLQLQDGNGAAHGNDPALLPPPPLPTAVSFNQQMEAWASEHPLVRRLVTHGGWEVYVNVATGEISSTPPPVAHLIQGGLFCDEPGLGKTVTAMSLILKTLGRTADPPHDAQVLWLTTPGGRRLGSYLPATTHSRPADTRALNKRNTRARRQTRQASTDTAGDSTGQGSHQQSPTPARTKSRSTDALAQQSQPIPPQVMDPVQSWSQPVLPQALSIPHIGVLDPAQSPHLNSHTGSAGADSDHQLPQQPVLPQPHAAPHLLNAALQPLQPPPPLPPPMLLDSLLQCPAAQWQHIPPSTQPSPSVLLTHSNQQQHALGVLPGNAGSHTSVAGLLSSRNSSHQSPGSLLQSAHHSLPNGGSQWCHTTGSQVAEQQQEPRAWVQCDTCQKWRELPFGFQVDSDLPWFCDLHPDPDQATCAAPEQETDHHKDSFERWPGFILSGYEDAQQENIDHFYEVLSSFPQLPSVALPVLALAFQVAPGQLTQLSGGFFVNNELRSGYRQASKTHYVDLFRRMHLVTLHDLLSEGQKTGRNGQKRKHSEDSGPALTKQRLAIMQHTWVQPPQLTTFSFDQRALQLALARCALAGHFPETNTRLQAVCKQLRSTGADGANAGSHRPHQRVFLSAATLVVVPSTLVAHWRQQLARHVQRGWLRVCEVTSDGRTSACPSAKDLAWNYDIVITTLTRLASEWAPKSAGAVLDKGHDKGTTHQRPSLLQVHWLRVILDEGHMLGASLNETNKLQVACQLKAERRWIMTGTPTPNTTNSGAAHLQPLLSFLHHDPYGVSRKTWEAAVLKPLESQKPYGRDQLMRLLRSVMIRASKSDLQLLPPMIFKVTKLDFAPEHAASYNALVEVVRRNLLLADWGDEDHWESLMNKRQSKWAKEMMNNVRLSCCVAGSTDLVPKEEDILETLELLCERLNYLWPAQAWYEFNRKQQASLQRQQQQQKVSQDAHARGVVSVQLGGDGAGAAQPVVATALTEENMGGSTGNGSLTGRHPEGVATDTAAITSSRVQDGTSAPGSTAPAERTISVGTLTGSTAGAEPAADGGANGSGSQPAAAAAAGGQPFAGTGRATGAGSIPGTAPGSSGASIQRIGGRWLPPGHPLTHVEEALRNGGECQLCSAFIGQPVVTPCAHLLCLDCVALSSTHCPLRKCGTPYVMQPVDDPARFKHNPNPKWPVPMEVIEWQPVYHQSGEAAGSESGHWSPNWRITRSTRCLYLIRRLTDLGLKPPNSQQTHHQPPHLSAKRQNLSAPRPLPPQHVAGEDIWKLPEPPAGGDRAYTVPSAAAPSTNMLPGGHQAGQGGANPNGNPSTLSHSPGKRSREAGTDAHSPVNNSADQTTAPSKPRKRVRFRLGSDDSSMVTWDRDEAATEEHHVRLRSPPPPEVEDIEHDMEGVKLPAVAVATAMPGNGAASRQAVVAASAYRDSEAEVATQAGGVSCDGNSTPAIEGAATDSRNQASQHPAMPAPPAEQCQQRSAWRRTATPAAGILKPSLPPGPDNHMQGGSNLFGSDSSGFAAGAPVTQRPVCEHKVIVFSQFWMHLQLIAQELTRHGIQFVNFASNGKTRTKAMDRDVTIHRFANDPHLGVLLMDEAGAVGLDLSFVDHIFLMEPLADRSLEHQLFVVGGLPASYQAGMCREKPIAADWWHSCLLPHTHITSMWYQIVSRAHRMGAKRTVHVELLVMRNTAEDKVLSMYYQDEETGAAGAGAAGAGAAGAGSVAAEQSANGGPAAGAAGAAGDDAQAGDGGLDAAASGTDGRSLRNQFFRSLRKVNMATLVQYEDCWS